jgi:hypothetical protein
MGFHLFNCLVALQHKVVTRPRLLPSSVSHLLMLQIMKCFLAYLTHISQLHRLCSVKGEDSCELPERMKIENLVTYFQLLSQHFHQNTDKICYYWFSD